MYLKRAPEYWQMSRNKICSHKLSTNQRGCSSDSCEMTGTVQFWKKMMLPALVMLIAFSLSGTQAYVVICREDLVTEFDALRK